MISRDVWPLLGIVGLLAGVARLGMGSVIRRPCSDR